MKLETILNLAAIIIIPIFAVIVGHHLQNRAKKRDDKMSIFRTLMTGRIYGSWTVDSVHALNIIDVVFADDAKVREQWKHYYDKLCIQNPTEMDTFRILTEKNKLLEVMAESLGYKDKITWETIQNPYVPQGMANDLALQRSFQVGQIELIQKINDSISNVGANPQEQNEKLNN